jgi:hypothetical protein
MTVLYYCRTCAEPYGPEGFFMDCKSSTGLKLTMCKVCYSEKHRNKKMKAIASEPLPPEFRAWVTGKKHNGEKNNEVLLRRTV